MKLLILTGFVFLLHFTVIAQDDVKFMQYNLLYYGVNTGYCTTTNNSVTSKENYLSQIIDYVLPDIFTVNEMASDITYIERVLNNTLNVNGRTWYKKAGFTNYAGSDIVNMLYYDSRKFTLYSQETIYSSLRDINMYHLYYNSPDITTMHDTAYISCIVAHLKAGSNPDDADDRGVMAGLIMGRIETKAKIWNYLVMGDFNVYTSSETAIQTLINYSNPLYNFNDPIDQMGDWNNNYSYAPYHTQSTHTSSDCFAGGGLDDRFDFILMSNSIKDNAQKISYVNGSYYALGQDGNHYNQDINAGTNTAVPSNIANALYGMSDHLPVIMQLRIDQTPAIGIETPFAENTAVKIVNPAGSMLEIYISAGKETTIDLKMIDQSGRVVLEKRFEARYGSDKYIFPLDISPGLYFLNISPNDQNSVTRKLIKM